MKQSFEDFLLDQCPSGCHTNNSPEGFERWLEQLDGQEYMDFAEEYGQKCYEEGVNKVIELRRD